jgi:hypothetical protein
VTTHPFLSDAWIDEARRIHEEYRGRTAPIEQALRINLVIKEVPFGDGTLPAHVDTSSGDLDIDTGHLDGAETTLTLDYATARAIIVEQDAQAAMQAYLGGRIKVEGDLTKLLLLQGVMGTPDPMAVEAAGRITAMTE